MWCSRCWYGATLLCAEGRKLTTREMFSALAAAWLVLWARRLQIRAFKMICRARRMDPETVAYLESIEAEKK